MRKRYLNRKRFNLLFIIVNMFKVPFMFGRTMMYLLLMVDTMAQIAYHTEELWFAISKKQPPKNKSEHKKRIFKFFVRKATVVKNGK